MEEDLLESGNSLLFALDFCQIMSLKILLLFRTYFTDGGRLDAPNRSVQLSDEMASLVFILLP